MRLSQSFLILFLLGGSCGYSQEYLNVSENYIDRDPISIILLKNKIEQYIIYQTTVLNNRIVRSGHTDSLASFLFWKEGTNYYVKMIKKDHIFSSENIDLMNFFSDPSLKNVGAVKSEGGLKFVPPGLEPYESEMFICNVKGKEFFFEVDAGHYYVEDPSKFEDRRRVSNILREAAKSKLSFFKTESSYQRLEILEKEK